MRSLGALSAYTGTAKLMSPRSSLWNSPMRCAGGERVLARVYLCVCVCVCVCVYVYVCMCMCMYACLSVFVDARVRVRVYESTNLTLFNLFFYLLWYIDTLSDPHASPCFAVAGGALCGSARSGSVDALSSSKKPKMPVQMTKSARVRATASLISERLPARGRERSQKLRYEQSPRQEEQKKK
jgi:uncharacterized membrane protein